MIVFQNIYLCRKVRQTEKNLVENTIFASSCSDSGYVNNVFANFTAQILHFMTVSH